MAIKQLPTTDNAFVFRVIAIAVLTTGAVAFSYFFPRAPQPKKEILSEQAARRRREISPQIQNLVGKTEETAQAALEEIGDAADQAVASVLGEATKLASDAASKSSEAVGDFLIDTAIGNIVKQVEKLPQEQQEKIKEQMCK